MKHLIMIFAALALLPFISDAQIVIKKTQDKSMSSVSATVVKKNVIYKERKLYDAKVGFQQFVELSPKFDFLEEEYGHTGIHYIGGWRFNNWIYAGVGTGLEFAHYVAKGAKAAMGDDVVTYTYSKYGDDYFTSYDIGIESMNGCFNRVSIPLYLHCRAYYMRTKWAPYSSISFGGRLAPRDCGCYFDFSTGVDWRINEDYHAYCSLGLWASGMKYTSGRNFERSSYTYYAKDESCRSSDCPYQKDHSHTTFYNIFHKQDSGAGLSFRIGVSF